MVFAGDELVDRHTYRRLMTGGYMATTAYLATAAEALHVQPDRVTEERWRRLASASYYIDEFIDTAPNKERAHALYALGLGAALGETVTNEELAVLLQTEHNPLLVPSIELLHNSVADSSSETLTRLRTRAFTINDAMLHKAATSNIREYIAILEEEITATVELLEYTALPATTEQAGYPQLRTLMHHAMRVAVFLDSALDLKDDYEQGITQVAPTVRHMGHLALKAVWPARELTRFGGNFRASWHVLRQVRPYIG